MIREVVPPDTGAAFRALYVDDLDRADAHRVYLNSGMVIAAHHFARRVA